MMSVLLRANSSEDPKSKMSEDEMIDQISCVFDVRALADDIPSLTHARSRV